MIQLLFAPESLRIAVKPLEELEDSALKLRKPERVAGTRISAKGFLEHFQLATPKRVA